MRRLRHFHASDARKTARCGTISVASRVRPRLNGASRNLPGIISKYNFDNSYYELLRHSVFNIQVISRSCSEIRKFLAFSLYAPSKVNRRELTNWVMQAE